MLRVGTNQFHACDCPPRLVHCPPCRTSLSSGRDCPAEEAVSRSRGRCIGTIPTGFRLARHAEGDGRLQVPPLLRAEHGPDIFGLSRRRSCGRIAAILNQGHVVHYNERRGFFGFFECRDDQEAANGLFDAVRRWFADQDIHLLRGPTNPSLNYELGTLIDGFDPSPTFMMTYNPRYYPRLIEIRLPQNPGPVRLLGAHRHAAQDRRETRAYRRADHRALQRQAAVAGQVAVCGTRADVPVAL